MKLLKLVETHLIYSNINETEAPYWSNTETYDKGDEVIVGNQIPHKIYLSLVDNNTGNYPPDYVWKDLENNYSEWNRTSTYSSGDRVKVSYEEDGITPLDTPQAFESLTDDNKGNYPPTDTTHWKSLDLWKDLGATNKYAMFDDKVMSQTVNSDVIEVVVEFSNCDAFALFNLYADSIEWELYDGSYANLDNLVISGEISNLQEPVSDWYEYFFSDILWKDSVFVSNLPKYRYGQLRIKINPVADKAKCGLFVYGKTRNLGDTLFDAKVGIIDFSKKEIDDEGNATLKQGNFVKRAECDIWTYTKGIDIIRKELASVRATPSVFIFNNQDTTFDSLIIYGFFRDFDILLSNPIYSKCSITVEGLI